MHLENCFSIRLLFSGGGFPVAPPPLKADPDLHSVSMKATGPSLPEIHMTVLCPWPQGLCFGHLYPCVHCWVQSRYRWHSTIGKAGHRPEEVPWVAKGILVRQRKFLLGKKRGLFLKESTTEIKT